MRDAAGDGLSERLLAGLQHVFGDHPGHRPTHASGTVCAGSFVATPAASGLTRAAHLRGHRVPTLVRFSSGSGVPAMPDHARDRRGMAVKFRPPDGSATDIVAITLPVFFVRRPEDFVEYLHARESAFVDAHPEAGCAVDLSHEALPPESYARAEHYAVHAYRMIDAAGGERFVRYHWEPVAGARALRPADARGRGRQYLRDDLRERLRRGPVASGSTSSSPGTWR